MLDILNSRLPGDPYAEYSHTTLTAFMKSEFMTARFEECEKDKTKLSKLICEYLNKDNEYKVYKGELLRAFEDGIREEIQLEVMREFKRNYLAKHGKNRKKLFAKICK